MKRYRRGVLVPLVGVALLAAACGSDDSSSDAGGPTTTTQPAATTAAHPTAATSPGGTPASMDDWFKLWASERAGIVERIKDGGSGLSTDGKTVTGPGDFKIDLTKCP